MPSLHILPPSVATTVSLAMKLPIQDQREVGGEGGAEGEYFFFSFLHFVSHHPNILS